MKALKFLGVDVLAAASVLAACWAAFAAGRLMLVGLGVRTPPPIHQEVFQYIVAVDRGQQMPADAAEDLRLGRRWLPHPNNLVSGLARRTAESDRAFLVIHGANGH
jgi:hypothetical protein